MTTKVFHESADDLGREIRQMGVTRLAGDRCSVDVDLPPDSPFLRAWFRAEAELLVADALAMQVGTYQHREPDERRDDAFELVVRRVAMSVAA